MYDDDEIEVEIDDGKPVYYLPRWVLIAIIVITLITLLASQMIGLFIPGAHPPPLPTPPLSLI